MQRKITAGVVDVGFTPEMVRMALGAPTRVISRQSELGSTEIWVYRENSPRVSVGFGIGSYGRHSASSIGVATTTGGRERGESERVEFHEGKVTKVESSRG